MAQNSWFYTFPDGRKYEIGLFHGSEGHVVIHCDGQIMVIDFNVTDNKQYSFFIENALLKIDMQKNASSDFEYFLVDESPSYRPERRSQNKFFNRKESIFLMFSALLFIGALYYFLG